LIAQVYSNPNHHNYMSLGLTKLLEVTIP